MFRSAPPPEGKGTLPATRRFAPRPLVGTAQDVVCMKAGNWFAASKRAAVSSRCASKVVDQTIADRLDVFIYSALNMNQLQRALQNSDHAMNGGLAPDEWLLVVIGRAH